MKHNQKGFTIVELMIATSVFAVVLIICTVAMLQIGRTYYKGITSSRTQETAREIIEEVSKAIQYGSGVPERLSAGANLGYCIGNKRFSYRLDRQIADSPVTGSPQNQSLHALVVDEGPCAGGPPLTVAPSPPADPINAPGVGENPHELLNTRMRLAVFRICFPGDTNPDCPNPPPAGSGLYEITVRVVSGDTDLLTADHMSCAMQRAGGQFCAVSQLRTIVQKRVE